MSARVFNRFAMSEARAPRGLPPGQEIERARRVLFVESTHNCNQAAQARQVAAEELADTLKQKSQQWNFDFGRGVPLESSNSRLKWQKQDQTERVPEAYAMERLPFLSSHTASEEQEDPSPTPPEEAVVPSSRQASITEYMPKRKNSSTAGCSKSGSLTASTSSSKAATEPAPKKQKTTSS